MKIRNGFVSNSSSSSFICDYCGAEISGCDMELADVEMHQCVNGHTICDDHILEYDERALFIQLVKDQITKYERRIVENPDDKDYPTLLENEKQLLTDILSDEDYDYDDIIGEYELRYSLPVECCPICQMKKLPNRDLIKYLLKKEDTTEEEIIAEVKANFKDYDAFIDYIKSPEDEGRLMKKFDKLDSIKYLVENNVYDNEWSGAGMYHAVEDVINNDAGWFEKSYLDHLLKNASEF